MTTLYRKSGIYAIRCLPTGRTYVGSAVCLGGRRRMHLRELQGQVHCNVLLQRAWNKYGEQAFTFEVLEFVPERTLLIEREQHWIEHEHTLAQQGGFNIAPRAGSQLGFRQSPEAKAKVSRATKEIKRSVEARARIGAAHRGKVVSPETRKRQSAAQKRRFATLGISQETRSKMSATRARPGIAYAPNGEVYTFASLPQFCEQHGLCYSVMSRVAAGARPAYRKWRCVFSS